MIKATLDLLGFLYGKVLLYKILTLTFSGITYKISIMFSMIIIINRMITIIIEYNFERYIQGDKENAQKVD